MIAGLHVGAFVRFEAMIAAVIVAGGLAVVAAFGRPAGAS